MNEQFYIYILASKQNGTLYIGVTSNLEKRIYEHKHKLLLGFTAQYDVDKLIYYENTSNVESAIAREKQLKGWSRKKKLSLIESTNPEWKELDI